VCNVSFMVCLALCAVFCLSVVCYFVLYVCFCVLCLILVPMPKGKKPFAVQLNNSNNSIQFFVIYVPSQQLQGQLQTQHSVDTIIIIESNNVL
jgi:hypothetical protein